MSSPLQYTEADGIITVDMNSPVNRQLITQTIQDKRDDLEYKLESNEMDKEQQDELLGEIETLNHALYLRKKEDVFRSSWFDVGSLAMVSILIWLVAVNLPEELKQFSSSILVGFGIYWLASQGWSSIKPKLIKFFVR